MMRTGLPILCALLFADTASAAERVDYLRDIKPVLAEKCFACHGAWKQKGKLRLETVALMRRGGRDGAVVVPGKPADSPLIARVAGTDPDMLMPPSGEGERLTPGQLALFKRWVEQGADGPDEPIPPDPREHWAFHAPKRGVIPKIKNQISTNPVDAFLAAEWEKRGLIPEPEAEKHVLLRRVYLDLTGLPPTREEL